jgi:hypothetical protein
MVEHSEQVENGKNDETIIYVFNSNDHERFEVQEMEPVESFNTQSFQPTYTEQQLQATEEVPDISIDKQPENVIDIVHAIFNLFRVFNHGTITTASTGRVTHLCVFS